MIKQGRINVVNLITDRFPFLQYLKAYRYIDERKDEVMKVEIYLK